MRPVRRGLLVVLAVLGSSLSMKDSVHGCTEAHFSFSKSRRMLQRVIRGPAELQRWRCGAGAEAQESSGSAAEGLQQWWGLFLLTPLLTYMLLMNLRDGCKVAGCMALLLLVDLTVGVILAESGPCPLVAVTALVDAVIVRRGYLELKRQQVKEQSEVEELRAHDVYMDLMTPLPKSAMIFTTQTLLANVYVIYVAKAVDDLDKEEAPFQIRNWFFAAVVIQAMIWSDLLEGFNLDFWIKVAGARHVRRLDAGVPASGNSAVRKLARGELTVRFLMSFSANLVYKQLLVVMVPWVLNGSPDGINFVKDSFATFFISQLDDIANPSTFIVQYSAEQSPRRATPRSGGERTQAESDRARFLPRLRGGERVR